MTKTLPTLLISCLLIGSVVSSFPSATYTTTCAAGSTYHLGVATAQACAASGACAAGTSDATPASATVNTVVSSTTVTSDCKYCAVSYVWDSPLLNNCISSGSSSTSNCVTGYSDQAPTSAGVNQNQTSATHASANCFYCAAGYYQSSSLAGLTAATYYRCVNTTCDAGYADVNTGYASASGSLTGNCKYCSVAYADNVNGSATSAGALATGCIYCAVGYTDNASTPTGTAAVAPCTSCQTGYAYNQPIAVTSGWACVMKNSTTTGKCSGNFADYANGTVSAAGSLSGPCNYCKLGWSDKAPVNGTNMAPTNGTAVAACSNCAAGYTLNSTSGLCALSTSSSSSFLMVSISLMATLIMIFF